MTNGYGDTGVNTGTTDRSTALGNQPAQAQSVGTQGLGSQTNGLHGPWYYPDRYCPYCHPRCPHCGSPLNRGYYGDYYYHRPVYW